MSSDSVGHAVFAAVSLVLLVGSVLFVRHAAVSRGDGAAARLAWLTGLIFIACFSLLLVFTLGQVVQALTS